MIKPVNIWHIIDQMTIRNFIVIVNVDKVIMLMEKLRYSFCTALAAGLRVYLLEMESCRFPIGYV